jgi:hypothetical protein
MTAAVRTGQPAPTRRSGPDVAAQRRRQRQAQAEAMLRGIARTQQGQPAPRVRVLLCQALRAVRVRLPDQTLTELATAISAGRPVTLP